MKRILLAMFFTAGIVITGSEANTITNQFISSSIGIAVMGASAWGLTRG